jgi:hypothetical protein
MATLASITQNKIAETIKRSNNIMAYLKETRPTDDVIRGLLAHDMPVWMIYCNCTTRYLHTTEQAPIIFLHAPTRTEAIKLFVSLKLPAIGMMIMSYFNSYIASDCYCDLYKKFKKIMIKVNSNDDFYLSKMGFTGAQYEKIIDEHVDDIINYCSLGYDDIFYCEKLTYDIVTPVGVEKIRIPEKNDFWPLSASENIIDALEKLSLPNVELRDLFDHTPIWMFKIRIDNKNYRDSAPQIQCIRAKDKLSAIHQFVDLKGPILAKILTARDHSIKTYCAAIYYYLKAQCEQYGEEYKSIVARYRDIIADFLLRQDCTNWVFTCCEVTFECAL